MSAVPEPAGRTSRFATDTAVHVEGDGRYTATVDASWWIIRGPNGGYLAAMVVRAVSCEVAGSGQRLRSLTLHYLRAPEAGPLVIDVRAERRGRTLTSLSIRVHQGDRLVILGLAATAEDRSGPDFDDLAVPAVAPPVEPTPPVPTEPGAVPVPMRDHYEMQPVFGPAGRGAVADEAVTGGWIRLADPEPVDDAVVAALSDAWTPAIFTRVAEPLGVPTIDLTIHFREPPPEQPAWTLVRFRSRHASGGYVEEDGELWSSDGRLLAQSRQLAVELPM